MTVVQRNGAPLVPLERKTFPAAVPVRVRPMKPTIKTVNGKTIIVGHEEFATLSGSVAFAATRHLINPGLSGMFAWLSGRATGYDKYRVVRLEYHYVPAEAVTTTAGVVYMAFDYDPDDAPPSTLAALSTYEGLESGHAYESFSVVVDNRKVNSSLLKIRDGPVCGSRLLYDPCSLIVGTVSMGGTSAVGQLWVGYEIELVAPQTEPSSRIPSAFMQYNLSADQAFTTNVIATLVFDERVIDGIEPTVAAGVFTMPRGLFHVSGVVSATDGTAETFETTAQVYKNGAALAIPATTATRYTNPAGGYVSVPFDAYVDCAAGDTISIAVRLVGAAGTLACSGDRCKLSISAV